MYEDVALPDSSSKGSQPVRSLASALCIGHEKRVQPNKHFVRDFFYTSLYEFICHHD